MRFLAGHRHAIRALAYAPGTENLLVSAGDDRQVRFWNPALGEAAEPLTAHGDSLVVLRPCNGSNWQRWIATPVSGQPGFQTWTNRATHKILQSGAKLS